MDADAEGRPLRASRGARAARPRYRSVLRRPMSLFGPSQVDSIRHTQEERCVLHPCFGAQGSSGPAVELTGLVLLQSNPSEVTEHPLGYLEPI